MGAISEQALSRLRGLEVPMTGDVPVQNTEQGYWADRYDRVRGILGDVVLSSDEMVAKILASERDMPALRSAETYDHALRFALEAVLIDEDLSGAERLDHFISLEGGGKPSGFQSHGEATAFLIKIARERAPDGLVLRLDYSDPADGMSVTSGGIRNFVSATPYQIDVKHTPRYVFEREGTEPSPGSYLASDSGLHFRTTTAVYQWQQRNRTPEIGSVRVYGVYTHDQDLMAWSPYGSGWSSSEYPDRGPSIHYGEEAIAQTIEQRLAHGGSRLDKIQQDVGDYPGFAFIHDIRPTGRAGADADTLA